MPTLIMPIDVQLEAVARSYAEWERIDARREILHDMIDWRLMTHADRRAAQHAADEVETQLECLSTERYQLARANEDQWWWLDG